MVTLGGIGVLYTVISFKEREKWDQALIELKSHKDIYYMLSYHNLYRNLGDGEPYLFIFTYKNGEKILYPFLKRKLNHLPFLQNDLTEDVFDITTCYGYGGPIYSEIPKEDIWKQFRTAFKKFCEEENIITEFIRFHPLFQNQRMMEKFMSIEHNRYTFYIDLEKQEEEIFNHYHQNHRRNIKKAKKLGLQFDMLQGEDAAKDLTHFMELYKQTMEKNQADDYYYFSKNYFEELFRDLEHNAVMAVVRLQNRIIAAAIFLFSNNYLHYHLGCSDKQYLKMAPNNLLFHESARWGKRMGFTKLHLGGGYKDNDQLFQFKSRFNPSGITSYYVGKEIHNLFVYEEIMRLWKQFYSKDKIENFLQFYWIN